MIIVRNIRLLFGQQKVFDDVSLTISPGQKIGLVGRNGMGKSTLLKVLVRSQQLDGGSIEIQKQMNIGYMPQESVLDSDKKILDEGLAAIPGLIETIAHARRLEEELLLHPARADLIEQYGLVQCELQEYDVDAQRAQVKRILSGLGFSNERMEQRVNELSVGWKMRVLLAKLLLGKSDIYLFDEPTNHLDIVAKDWFLDYLKSSSAGFLLVSHDRFFLDQVCDYILELESGKATLYQGNYTRYLTRKEEDALLLEQRYEEQQRDIKKRQETIERFRAKASKAKMAQSMAKQLDRIEMITPPRQRKKVAFSFKPVERSGTIVITVSNLAAGYDTKKIVEHISCEIMRGEKVALVAANGVGKTTLFKAIAGKLTPSHGTVTFGHKVKVALFEQDQNAILTPDNTILREVEDSCITSEDRQRVRTMLGSFLFSGDDVHKKIRVLSGGEKNRVAMVKVLMQGANVLLLDEPTNHLDLESKEVLLSALQQYDGTILFVSHDRDFIQHLATRIIELTPTKAISYPGGYESYLYHKKQYEQNFDQPSRKEMVPVMAKAAPHKEKQQSHQENKKLKNLEAKIDKLERWIAHLKERFADVSYGSEAYSKLENDLKTEEAELAKLMKEWEAYEQRDS